MISSINMTDCRYDAARYSSPQDFNEFYENFGLNGIELMFMGEDFSLPKVLSNAIINGLHLNCLNSLIDLLLNDKEALIREYGSLEECKHHTGCQNREDLIKKYQAQLNIAEKLKVKYVVFHVSDVTLWESVNYTQRYSDKEIVLAFADFINTLTENKNYSFDFLCENLWWAGMNLKSPEITELTMNSINYKNKGIMLDTGHLMHLNNDLKTEDEAVDFILDVLNKHLSVLPYIKGIHLHKSLTGAYVKENLQNPIKLSGNYSDKMTQTMMFIYGIDTHKAFTTPRACEIIKKINPKYLTHEFISSSRAEHYELISQQLNSIGQKQNFRGEHFGYK